MAKNKDTSTEGLRKQLEQQQNPKKQGTSVIIQSNSTMKSEGQRKVKNRRVE